MEDIRTIVEGLSRPPFDMRESIVSFHKKSPTELLQVVNNVFALLDPKQKKDIREEKPEGTATRMISFLGVLQYKIDDMESFTADFMSGQPAVIYPLLVYCLERFPALSKRAHLAHFLAPVDVPEEFYADPSVVAMVQQMSQLQEEFKRVHEDVEKSRQTRTDPTGLQREIDTLQREHEQLTTKLAERKTRVQQGAESHRMPFDEVLQKTHLLRKEQELENKLYNDMREQKMLLEKSVNDLRAISQKHKDLMSSDLVRAEPAQLLAKARQEVAKLRQMNDDELEKIIMEKQKQARELEHNISSEPYSDDQVHELDLDVKQLQAEIADLAAKRDQVSQNADMKIPFYRDRAVAAEKKKNVALEALTEVQAEMKDAEEDLKRLNAELKQLTGGQKPKTEAEVREYMKTLAKKKEKYKKCKEELDYEANEVVVLKRTEEILKSRSTNLQQFMLDLEKEKGIAGYNATQQGLEDLSKLTSKFNLNKEATLNELSEVVNKINETLKVKKNKLTPQIKELRLKRQLYEEMLADYTKKKKVYEALVGTLSQERNKLEADVNENLAGISAAESQYHLLNAQALVLSVRTDQIAQEQSFQAGEGRLNSEHRSYKEMLDKVTNTAEVKAKELREEKKTIKETHLDSVGQRQMFLHLKKLLSCKLKVSKDSREQRTMETTGENIMKMGDDYDQ